MLLETAHSLPPESGGSRSPERRRQNVDAVSTCSAQPVFCVRSSDSAQLSSWAVLHSRVVASQVCGKGRSESPSTAAACLGGRLNSVSPDGNGAARRWGCNHGSLVSAVARGETPPLAAEASKAASDRLMRLQRASRVSDKCLTARADAARAV